MMNRAEHLAWAKKRALEYVEIDQLDQAFSSLVSDLRKHPELESHIAIGLGGQLLFGGHLNSRQQMREFIEGCN